MDFVRAEIESKKRSLESLSAHGSVSTSSAPAPKYLKRSDIERQRVEDLRREEEAEREAQRNTKRPSWASRSKDKSVVESEVSVEGTITELALVPVEGDVGGAALQEKLESFNVTAAEAVRRLRAKGQPIRLFGESDKSRRLRLRALELIEERTDGQQNDFARAMDGMEMGLELHKLEMEAKGRGSSGGEKSALSGGDAAQTKEKSTGERKPKDEVVLVELSLVKSNPHKIYPQIYFALKRILGEWEQSLAERPDAVRRSTQGKIAAATQQTSADYLKPLFKSLRKRDLAPDVLLAIAEITYNMQIREYLKANDAYLRLSIGNAPWPIGVTMVGIHERAGREKIFSNNVGHVLNDETSRKYIQSIKRLLTFAQTKYPPIDGSQKMG